MTDQSEGTSHTCDDSLDPPYKACGRIATHKRSYYSRASRLGQPDVVIQWFCEEHAKRYPLPEVIVPSLSDSERRLMEQVKSRPMAFLSLNPTNSVVLERTLVSLKERGLMEFYLDTPHQPLCGPQVRLTPAGAELLRKESA